MKADLPALQGIAAAVFGHGYGTADLFENPANSILVLKKDWAPVGFAVHRPMTDDAMKAASDAGIVLPEGLHWSHRRQHLQEIKSVAVAPHVQRQGLGSLLMDNVLQTLDNLGRSAIVPAWKVDGAVNIGPLLASRDFTVAGELKNIWKMECEARSFDCPARAGKHVCRCSAVLYYRFAN